MTDHQTFTDENGNTFVQCSVIGQGALLDVATVVIPVPSLVQPALEPEREGEKSMIPDWILPYANDIGCGLVIAVCVLAILYIVVH